MRQGVRLVRLPPERLQEANSADGNDENGVFGELAGCILEQPFGPPAPVLVGAWGYLVVMTDPLREPGLDTAVPMLAAFNSQYPEPLQLRPVGRLVPVTASQAQPQALMGIRRLRPVQSGQSYRIISPQARGLVTLQLAEALETVFERFAGERGFTPEKPLEIQLARGFKAGSHGHGEGRAVDIAAVAGKRLVEWKREWDRAMADAEKLDDPQQCADAIAAEQKRNLGYGLYKTLQEHGGWRVNPKGWRPYRGVMQLFGPWTVTEGPWKAMQIKSPNEYQLLRLADQQWVFRAHQDHIHVAR